MPAPCEDLLLSSRPGRCIQAGSQEPRCTIPSRFSFYPGAWPIATFDPRICPGRTSGGRRSKLITLIAIEQRERERKKKRPQVGHTGSYNATAVAVAPSRTLSPVEVVLLSQPVLLYCLSSRQQVEIQHNPVSRWWYMQYKDGIRPYTDRHFFVALVQSECRPRSVPSPPAAPSQLTTPHTTVHVPAQQLFKARGMQGIVH